MEVRKGYKQTEVGVIPDDWDVKTLGDICKYQNGIALEGYYNKFEGVRVISIGNYSNTGKYVDNSTFINDNHRTVIKDFILNKGDLTVILNDKTPAGVIIGRALLIPKDNAFVFNQRTMRLMPHPNVFSAYLYFVINSDFMHSRMKSLAKTGTQIYLNTGDITEFAIQLPPTLAEQEAIAEALSDADALIEAVEQLLTKKRQVKQGAMSELLTGKRRLAGFSGEWENKKLGKLCEIVTGKKNVNEGDPDGVFPFFTCSRSITYSNSYSFDTEAILIAGNGDVGTLHYYKGKFEAYQRTYVLDKFQVDVQYLNQYFKHFLIPTLLLGKIGSSIPYILLGNLLEFTVSMPKDEEEARMISTILIDMDAEITALEGKLVKARQVKAGMMSELLTGKIRLVQV